MSNLPLNFGMCQNLALTPPYSTCIEDALRMHVFVLKNKIK